MITITVYCTKVEEVPRLQCNVSIELTAVFPEEENIGRDINASPQYNVFI